MEKKIRIKRITPRADLVETAKNLRKKKLPVLPWDEWRENSPTNPKIPTKGTIRKPIRKYPE